MRKTAFIGLLVTSALSLLGVAGPVVQELNLKQSRVHFSLTTAFLELSGKFNRYSGSLELNSALEPTRVNIKLDASEVNLAPVEQLGALSPEALFRSLPNPIVTFASTKIQSTGNNRFRVDGIVRRGGKQWPAHFNATLLKRTAQSSEFHFTTTGPILDLAEQLPFRTGGMNEEGSVECKLVFVKR